MINYTNKRKLYIFLVLTMFFAISSFVWLMRTPSKNDKASATSSTTISTANTCGMDIALVIDNSASIGSSQSTLKTAINSFIDAFSSTPTEFSVVTFNDSANIIQAFTSDTAAVKASINGIDTPSGNTNWQDALIKANSTFDPRPTKGNLIIFASDGDPTTYNGGSTYRNDPTTALSEAVTEANIIKASNTKILGLAIGSHANIDNFKQITGPNVSPSPVPIGNTTDIISTDFSNLSTNFANLYSSMCGSSIIVQNQIDTNGDDVADITGNTSDSLLSGFGFGVTGPTSSPVQSTDQTGTFQYTGLSAGTYTITETPKSNYNLVRIDCLKENAATGTFDNVNNAETNLEIAQGDNIYCTFLNAPIPHTPLINLNVGITPSEIPTFGSKVTFNYSVTNPGSVDIDQVNVTDTQCAPIIYGSGDTNNDGILQNTETWKYSCTRFASTALTSFATATAEYESQSVSATAGASVSVTPAGPPATGHAE